MIKKMYSIADQKSNIFLPPFVSHNDEDAKRQVLTMMLKQENMMSMYPEDYALSYLGEYDDVNGTISPNAQPVPMVNLKALHDAYKENTKNG
jgi:hypothetical protein